uniref:Uncharacterized protein n=1 Tax=Macrostomum lignano TaxID=282301 RepID=A0A1I8IYF0_9PLAT
MPTLIAQPPPSLLLTPRHRRCQIGQRVPIRWSRAAMARGLFPAAEPLHRPQLLPVWWHVRLLRHH